MRSEQEIKQLLARTQTDQQRNEQLLLTKQHEELQQPTASIHRDIDLLKQRAMKFVGLVEALKWVLSEK